MTAWNEQTVTLLLKTTTESLVVPWFRKMLTKVKRGDGFQMRTRVKYTFASGSLGVKYSYTIFFIPNQFSLGDNSADQNSIEVESWKYAIIIKKNL